MKINNQQYLVFGFLILILLAVFLYMGFVTKDPALYFSCTDGHLIGISSPLPPLMCGVCVFYCDGYIMVKDTQNNTICEEHGRTIDISETPKRVDVTCPNLDKYKGDKVILTYTINSSFGAFGNQTVLNVTWGKYENSTK